MKDAEFIELLNLYLDHEISPADAARLEAEVLGNLKRREIYRDYCRMQKSCKLLAQEFAAESATDADGKVVAFEPATVPHRKGYYVGGIFAAAACVAFIFVSANRNSQMSPGEPREAVTQTAKPANVIAVAPQTTERMIPRTVTMPPAREVQPMLVNALTFAGKSDTPATSLLSNPEPNSASFEWMQTMQLAPLQRVSIEEFHFDGRSPLRRDSRPYLTPRSQQGPMEWNAIRYQK